PPDALFHLPIAGEIRLVLDGDGVHVVRDEGPLGLHAEETSAIENPAQQITGALGTFGGDDGLEGGDPLAGPWRNAVDGFGQVRAHSGVSSGGARRFATLLGPSGSPAGGVAVRVGPRGPSQNFRSLALSSVTVMAGTR